MIAPVYGDRDPVKRGSSHEIPNGTIAAAESRNPKFLDPVATAFKRSFGRRRLIGALARVGVNVGALFQKVLDRPEQAVKQGSAISPTF